MRISRSVRFLKEDSYVINRNLPLLYEHFIFCESAADVKQDLFQESKPCGNK